MKKTFVLSMVVLLSFCANAQTQDVLDGAYIKQHNLTKQVIPYPHLREADVMWAKRIWQVIDLREKMNHPLYYPLEPIEDRKCLFDVIRHAALVEGSITAYGLGPTNDDDEFRYPLSHAALDSLMNPVSESSYIDPDTEEEVFETKANPITADKITQYKLKEDWIFDRQRSERYVRIIGILPMMEEYNDDGSKRGYRELFWVYYPYARYTFVNYDVLNPKNGAQRITFEDLFQKRLFSSYVVEEENVYNRSILAYARGVDALLESDRIKTKLFETEHDLWSY